MTEHKTKKKTGRPRNPTVVPDIDYLNALFAQNRKQQNEVAAKLGMRESTFAKSKAGKRPFTLSEAAGLAEEFNVSLDDLVPHLGHHITPRGVPIAGKVTADSRVSPVMGARKGERVQIPHAPPHAVAYLHEADGTVFAVDPGTEPGLPPGAWDRLCVIEADDHELPLLGKIGKAPHRNMVALTPYYGSETRLLKQIHKAGVVIAILLTPPG